MGKLMGTRFHERPHRFLDSAVGLARNDTFFIPLSSLPERGAPICCPGRRREATLHVVIPTEEALRPSGGISGREMRTLFQFHRSLGSLRSLGMTMMK